MAKKDSPEPVGSSGWTRGGPQ